MTSDFQESGGTIEDRGNNLIGDATQVASAFDLSTLLGSETTPLDPNFIRDADMDSNDPGDLRLWCTSPAIDAGTPDTTGLNIGTSDVLGLLRIVNGLIDIGAHEYFAGQLGDLTLDGTRPTRELERATNITAQVGVVEDSTLFQVEETAILESTFEVGDGKLFEVQIAFCPE